MICEVESAVDVLNRTPKVVRAMLTGLTGTWTAGGSETNWAPFDIVGHLVHGEQTDWIPRAEIILEHGREKTFTPFDRLAQFEMSKGQSLDELIDQFESLRAKNIETLRSWNLSDAQLRQNGKHPELGTVTLRQLIATWVVHDLTHIRQIATFIAKKCDPDVGPWKEYLSILN
jgi:hypothetical protein